jgi:hypothetical protein
MVLTSLRQGARTASNKEDTLRRMRTGLQPDMDSSDKYAVSRTRQTGVAGKQPSSMIPLSEVGSFVRKWWFI